MDDPAVTVAIPTKDAGPTLKATLASLEAQTYPRLEMIVVDNGSSDDTIDIAHAMGCRVLAGRFRERSAQMNAALQVATGRYFYRVDADFVVEPTVVEEAVAGCERSGFDAVLIHNTSHPANSIWAAVRRFERDMYRDDDLNVASRFVRTDLLRDLGGFDESLVAGEDYDLHRRLLATGAQIGRIGPGEVHVGEPTTLADVWNKHFYYGTTLGRYLVKHRGFAVKQLSPVRPAMVKHWREFVGQPALSVAFVAYLFVKYAAGLAGLVAETLGVGASSHARSGSGGRP